MKKILLSLVTVGLVSATVIGASSAFFNDTETSTGNVFAAGAIDLKIDNESYLNGVFRDDLSWELKDLTNELFFNYRDLKPGDEGEDTLSLHVYNNPSWVCVDIEINENIDNGCTDPEIEANDPQCTLVTDPGGEGELAQELNFVFWLDDGDNVLEAEEPVLTQGPASNVLNGVSWALADSNTNLVGGQVGDPFPGADTVYIGKAWCYGDLTTEPLEQDNVNDARRPSDQVTNPDGVLCDGEPVGNISQTDILRGSISFRAEQHRNNPSFECRGV